MRAVNSNSLFFLANLPTERKLTKKFRSSSQFHSLNRHFHTFTRFAGMISIHHQMQLDEIFPFKVSFFAGKPSNREKINEKILIFITIPLIESAFSHLNRVSGTISIHHPMQLDEISPFKLSFFLANLLTERKLMQNRKKFPSSSQFYSLNRHFHTFTGFSGTISIHHQMQLDEISPFKLSFFPGKPSNREKINEKNRKKFPSSSQFHSLNRHFHTFTRFVGTISIHHQMQFDETYPFKLSFFTGKPSKKEKINEKIRIFDPLNRHFHTFTSFAGKI